MGLVEPGSHDEGRLLSRYSRTAYFGEHGFETAQDASSRVLAIAQRENDSELELRTLVNGSYVETFHGNFQEATEMSLRGLDLARCADNSRVELGAYQWDIFVRLIIGDLQGAKSNLESFRDLAEKLQDRNWLATAYFLSAQSSIYEGDWEAARHFSDRGLAGLSMDRRCLATRMQVEFERGEPE